MHKFSRLPLLVIFAWLLGFGHPLRADRGEEAILKNANVALTEVAAMHFNKIPMTLLKNAQGVAIFPHVIKAAVGIGVRHGRGVLLVREADGGWGPPMFVTLSAASAGLQLGVEGADLVLILRTRSHLDRLMEGKLTLGVGDVLAVGPIGVDKALGTDLSLKTGIFSRSHCKGLFAGWCVEGARLHIDAAANAAYGQQAQDGSPTGGSTGPRMSPSLQLQMKLAEISAALPAHHEVAPLSGAPTVASQP